MDKDVFFRKNDLGGNVEYNIIGVFKWKNNEYSIYTDFVDDKSNPIGFRVYADLIDDFEMIRLNPEEEKTIINDFYDEIANFLQSNIK